MKKLKVYANGDAYIENDFLTILPLAEPESVYDVEDMKDDEIQKLKENPKNKTLLKKAKKL